MILICIFTIFFIKQCYATDCLNENPPYCEGRGHCQERAGCQVLRTCRTGTGPVCTMPLKRSIDEYIPLPDVFRDNMIPHQRKRP